MGKRRTRLIILAILLALSSQPRVLAPDLKGRTELVYQGRATPQGMEVTGEDIDSAFGVSPQGVDHLGVAAPELPRRRRDEIQVDLPNVSDTKRATDQI